MMSEGGRGMDERALLLLGILRSHSQHGYQIHDFIEKNLSRVTDMKKPTAYMLLDRLHRAGYVSETVEQEGNRPPRKVYAITPAGEAAFADLLRENLAQTGPLRQASDVGLMFLDYLAPAEAVACLERRLAMLAAEIAAITASQVQHPGCGVNLALERHHALLLADRDWLARTIARLRP